MSFLCLSNVILILRLWPISRIKNIVCKHFCISVHSPPQRSFLFEFPRFPIAILDAAHRVAQPNLLELEPDQLPPITEDTLLRFPGLRVCEKHLTPAVSRFRFSIIKQVNKLISTLFFEL